MGAIWQDLRYALRGIAKAPFLSFAVLLALSTGIGLNTAVFALLDSSWLRPPVEKDPDSFVRVIPSYSGWFSTQNLFPTFTVADYDAFRTRAKSFRQVAGYNRIPRAKLDDDSANANVGLVTCNFFDVYGWGPPVKGRLFLSEECSTPGSAPVAVITEALWRNRYSADPNIIGRSIHLDQRPYTIVGILDARMPTWMREEVWVPYTLQAEFWGGYDAFTQHPDYPWLFVAGRLKSGFSGANAQAELKSIQNQQDRLIPGRKTTLQVTNGSLLQDPDTRLLGLLIIPLVMGPMLLILLVACTNVTMLLLSRAAARRSEIAIRLTLGAGRGRLLRMLGTEGLIIAAAAGVISAYLASELPGFLWRFMLRESGYQALAPDWRVFAYLGGVTLLAACIAGLAPARESLKVDLLTSLKGQQSAATVRSRMWSGLIVAQMAMSFVLVAAGVAFTRIERFVTSADPGFETRQVFVVPLNVSAAAYTPESAARFYRVVRQRVSEIPGVRSADYTDTPPLTEPPAEEIRVPGEAKGQGQQVVVEQVSAGFFDTLGIRIVRGRAFEDSDAITKNATVAIVSQAFADAFWSRQDPLGKLVLLPDDTRILVVGVTRNLQSTEFGVSDGPCLYVPQNPQAFTGALMVRFDGQPRSVAPVIARTIRDLDATQQALPLTLRSIMGERAERIRPLTEIILVMAVLTVMLAVSGVYGTVAFSMSRRTREFGIRMALGATRGRILRSVLAFGIRQIGTGLLIGVLLALPAAFAFWHLLRTPSVFDWTTYCVAALALTLAALCAYYIPARRAIRLDPIAALRYE